jgi:hypothetical protein
LEATTFGPTKNWGSFKSSAKNKQQQNLHIGRTARTQTATSKPKKHVNQVYIFQSNPTPYHRILATDKVHFILFSEAHGARRRAAELPKQPAA